MKQGLKPMPLRLVGKDAGAQRGAIEGAVGLKNVLPEVLGDGGQCGLPWLDHLAGGQVRVHHRNAKSFEMIGDGGFPAANTPR
jgi:hypothetical protein